MKFRSLARRLLGRPSGAQRYQYIFQAIEQDHPQNILEIGTWDGERAVQMIRAAQHHSPTVRYYGFDLFEMMSAEIFEKEISKMPPTMAEVEAKLRVTNAEIHLYRGYTQETLPKAVGEMPIMDLIFIDGGHARETIQNDWDYAQKVMGDSTTVIFDDYWPDGFNGNMNDGCNHVVAAIDRAKFNVEILPIVDSFKKEWGRLKVQFVRVRKISAGA